MLFPRSFGRGLSSFTLSRRERERPSARASVQPIGGRDEAIARPSPSFNQYEGGWTLHLSHRGGRSMADNLTMAAFCRSKTGAGFVSYLCLSAIISAALAYGGYYLSREWFTRSKSEEKLTALQLVDAFVADYSDNRGKFMSGDAPVPATYRAHAIERFNKMRDSADALRLLMVGPAGRAIAIPPSDDDMAQTIRRFGAAAKPVPETRFVTLKGETFFRTLYPSLASQQSCVDCHNSLQPGAHWKLNDVLGAFVIDAPAGPFLARSRWQNAGLGL